MPRSLRTGTLLPLNLEIEKTAKRLRKQTRQQRSQLASGSSSSPLPPNTITRDNPIFSSESEPETQSNSSAESTPPSSPNHNTPPTSPKIQKMAEPEQTLREWAKQEVTQQPLCITYPAAMNFELKSGMIHLLPTFRGLENENPHKFLKEFHMVCQSMKPHTITEDQIKLRAFPFALLDSARDWLYDLMPASVETWSDLATKFLNKYFPEQKASILRREIIGIQQLKQEPLHAYYERFKNLCSRCPKHGISAYQLSQYFCEGLKPMDRRLLNASSGGSLQDKRPAEIWTLVENIAEDSKHSSHGEEWYEDTPRSAKSVGTSSMETQISELTKAVLLLTKGKHERESPLKNCGLCHKPGHFNDQCPLIRGELEDVNAVGGWNYDQPQQRGNQNHNYNQNNNNYPPRPQQNNHHPPGYPQRPQFPNQGYQQRQPNYQHQHHNPPPPASSSGMSLEDIVKSLATSSQSFQQETKASIKNLEQQLSQLATSVSKINSQGKLPAQTESNPGHKACAITLKSGKSYEGPKTPVDEEEVDEEIVVEEPEAAKQNVQKQSEPNPIEVKITPPPFPSRLKNTKKETEDQELMEIFRKVEVNIPLLDAIQQIPRYAKFLKELCTSKKKLKGNETIKVGENISAVLQKRLPQKCKDPGVFTVPCKLGNLHVPRAMLDLGASINVLPYSCYKLMGIGELSKTGVIIQLADRSIVHPKGVLEDVLVQVNELVFPADFYVLDMDDDDSPNPSSILLGRPFMKTAQTKIDVANGTLTMEFDGEVINFNIYEAMKYPRDVHSLHSVDVIQPLTEEWFKLTNPDLLELVLNRDFNKDSIKEVAENFKVDDELLETVNLMEEMKNRECVDAQIKLTTSNTKPLPSIVQAPELELKTLPDHLKYVYLGENETLPVIISTKLSQKEEDELVTLLKHYKKAIGWTIADIKGLSPSLCMHKILMEEDFKPTREAQRRLNPPMMEVVKKEIMKLLNAGMIYPISDSKWVSPIQVVPKKAGVTVVKNSEGELVPTREQNGWRVCIDYRKLNASTRKDHFPLPFIDQMLERLAGKSHYCCLDGFSGFHQIPVAPEDQDKNHIHLPVWNFCLQTHAIWSVQCTCNFSKVHGKYFF